MVCEDSEKDGKTDKEKSDKRPKRNKMIQNPYGILSQEPEEKR